MSKKEFKAESKRLLDLMINSIYTNKEIFLRELISNASDAEDKLYFKSLTDSKLDVKQSDLKIVLDTNKEAGTLSITDNGIGMDADELEKNLGTIAQSGTYNFKSAMKDDGSKENKDSKEAEASEDKISLIGQFGVGFYSAFMVADKVTVISKKAGQDKAYKWESAGAEGYEISETTKDNYGTTIILTLKKDNDDEKYSRYLEDYTLESLVKKYSDYIRYPIVHDVTTKKPKEGNDKETEEVTETKTLNSMVPIWKKDKKSLKDEDYKNFYMSKFFDFEEPFRWIHAKVEGQYSYSMLLYIPSHMPYDYFSKDYKKGLMLYSNGVLIMEHCEDLLPDYLGFVKGLIDSEDLSLNISREILQQDKQLKQIAKNIENKVLSELSNIMQNDRNLYEKIFKVFGTSLKAGAYDGYGINKDKLKDHLIFHSSFENELKYKDGDKEETRKTDYTSLKEYVSRMKLDQKEIYYCSSETIEKIKLMPQVENVLDKGFEVLYLDEAVDEFVLQMMENYDDKKFANVSSNNLDLDTEEEKKKLKEENEKSKDIFAFMKEAIEDKSIKEIRFTNRLKNHPVCLTTEGAISVEMQKVLNAMPDENSKNAKAETVLEINENHPIAAKIKSLYETDKEELKKYTKILLDSAKLIEGLTVDNPTELSNLICEIMTK